MTALEWQGCTLELVTPAPGEARTFARLAHDRGPDATAALVDVLDALLAPGEVDRFEDAVADGTITECSLAELLEDATEALSGRPLRAVVALSDAAVTQWSIIRGRLVRDGISDPLRALPTLWALLDAVESMILESKTEDKDIDAYWRDMYPTSRRQWSDSEEAAAADAFFAAFSS